MPDPDLDCERTLQAVVQDQHARAEGAHAPAVRVRLRMRCTLRRREVAQVLPALAEAKVRELSTPGEKGFFNVTRRALSMEINVSSKLLLGRAQNVHFTRVPVDSKVLESLRKVFMET